MASLLSAVNKQRKKFVKMMRDSKRSNLFYGQSKTSEANGRNSSKWTGHQVGLPKTFKMVKIIKPSK